MRKVKRYRLLKNGKYRLVAVVIKNSRGIVTKILRATEII